MTESLAERIDAQLPQTQCTRCGFPDCASYAVAIAAGTAGFNRCPPGGAATIVRLAELLNTAPMALDSECGEEVPRRVAFVDEAWCIGCMLCIEACPVDAIAGAAKRMHTIIESLCTGCELCIEPCPVECIHMEVACRGPSNPAQWLSEQAGPAKARYLARNRRRTAAAQTAETDRMQDAAQRRKLIKEAVARARARRESPL